MFLVWICSVLLAVGVARQPQQTGSTSDSETRRRVDDLLAEWREKHGENADALVAIGPRASLYLCDLLEGNREALPVEPIAHAVARLGSWRSTVTLGKLLESPLAEERAIAVDALRESAKCDVLPHLARALDDAEESVASRAEEALLALIAKCPEVVGALKERIPKAKEIDRLGGLLGRVGSKEARALLLELLSSDKEQNQLAALRGLWLMARPADGKAVAQVLRATDSVAVRKQACLLLGRIGFWPAIRDLIDLLHEEDQGLVANAHWALQQITGQRLKCDAELWERWWEGGGKEVRGARRRS